MEIMVHLDPRTAVSDDEAGETVRLISHSPGITSGDLSAFRESRGHPVPGFTGTERPTGRPGVSHRVHHGDHHLSRSIPTQNGERIVTVVRRSDDRGSWQGWQPATALFSSRWAELAAQELAELPAESSPTAPSWSDFGDRPPAMTPCRLRRFLLAEPWAVAALPAVLTMLDHAVAGSRSIAVRYPDTDQATRALAALSELLTADEAWALEFALPVVDPARSRATLMGVDARLHPHWDFERCRELGVHVIDLETKSVSTVDVSPVAARHARWFTDADGEDRLKVTLRGIDRSRRWSQLVDAEAAAATVEAIELMPRARLEPDEARLLAQALSGLAGAGDDHDVLAMIVRRLRSVDRWSGAAVTQLVDAVAGLATAGMDEAARSLAHTLLELIGDHPVAMVRWDEAVRAHEVDPLPDLGWPDDSTTMSTLFEQVAGRTNDANLPLLLQHAASLCPPGAEPLGQTRADHMAQRWADDPDAFSHDGWVGRDRVIAALAPILLARFDEQDVDALQHLRTGRWEWLRLGVDDSDGPDTPDTPDNPDGPDGPDASQDGPNADQDNPNADQDGQDADHADADGSADQAADDKGVAGENLADGAAGDEVDDDEDDGSDPWGLGQRRHARLQSWLALSEHLNADDDRRLEILTAVAEFLPDSAWLPFLGPSEDQLDDELVLWAQRRRRLEHDLGEAIFARLCDPEMPGHGEGRSLISALAGIEHLGVEHPELASWIDNDHRVRRLWTRARDDHDAVPNPALVSLADHHEEIIHLDHDEIVAAIASLDDVATATRMAEVVLESISDALAVRLDEDLRQARLPALAATLRMMELPDDHWWGLAKDCLDELWDDRAQAAVRTELATKAMHLDPEERRQFAFYQQTQADGRLGRNLRRTRGVLGDLARTVFMRD